jgi:UDP-3-O-[3-hydroxymyristoyl] N-acetylglucosamine deacetylase
MGIDNATIEVDLSEAPIMDGSSAAFVAAIDQAGVIGQDAPRRYIQVLKPVRVRIGEAFVQISPYAYGLRVSGEISSHNLTIGRQSFSLDINPESFRREVARARTFGEMKDQAELWSKGYGLGASFENSVIFDEERLLNPDGLRYPNECARHIVLDAVGDLSLAGLPLLAKFRSFQGGHKLNHAVLIALLADRTAWRVVEMTGQPGRSRFKVIEAFDNNRAAAEEGGF